METVNNMQEIFIKVKLVENFKVNEPFLYEILNGLGDHLVPVDEITLNGSVLFDNKNGFHRENFKGGIAISNGQTSENEDNSTGSQ